MLKILFTATRSPIQEVDLSDVIVSIVGFSTPDKRGYLQVSPDGEHIAFADYRLIRGVTDGSLVLFDFDNTSGRVNPTPQILIPTRSSESPYGVAFSQQSNKLYIIL